MIVQATSPEAQILDKLRESKSPWIIADNGTYMVVDMQRTGRFLVQRGALISKPAVGVSMMAAISPERTDEGHQPLREMGARILVGGGRLLLNWYEFDESHGPANNEVYPLYLTAHFGRSPSTRTIHQIVMGTRDAWIIRPDVFLAATTGIEVQNKLTIAAATSPTHIRPFGIAGSFSLLRVLQRQSSITVSGTQYSCDHTFVTLREDAIQYTLAPGQSATFDFGHIAAFPEQLWVVAGLPSTRSFDSYEKVKQYCLQKIERKRQTVRLKRRRQRFYAISAQNAGAFVRRVLKAQITKSECREAFNQLYALTNGEAKRFINGNNKAKLVENGHNHSYFYDPDNLNETSQQAFRRYAEKISGPMRFKGRLATNLTFAWRVAFSASIMRTHLQNRGATVTKRRGIGMYLDFQISRMGTAIMTSKFIRLLNDYSSGEGPVQTLIYNPTKNPMTIIIQSGGEIPGFGSGLVGAVATTPSKLVRLGNGLLRGLMTFVR